MKKSNLILLAPYILCPILFSSYLFWAYSRSSDVVEERAMDFIAKFDGTEIHVVNVRSTECRVVVSNNSPKGVVVKDQITSLTVLEDGLRVSNDTLYVTISYPEHGITISDPAIRSVVSGSESDVIFNGDTIR